MPTKSAAPKAVPTKATKKPSGAAVAAKVTRLQAVGVEASGDEHQTSSARLVAQLRVKDLIDRVISATDQSRRDVKIVVEAALTELAKALESGEALNLPPLGKVRIANQRNDESGTAMTLKLRRNADMGKAKKGGKEPLAEPNEAG